MVATPIGASSRYIPEGVTKYNWLPACANYLSPTRAEINAGTDLSPEIATTGNWGIISGVIDAPDLATLFTAQIAGKVTVDGPTIDMYADGTSTDVRTLLPRGTTGFILKLPEGDVAGRKCDVFPVKVVAQAKPTNLTNPSVIQLQFAPTKIPAENVTVPA
jgi:hypothetical protein